MAENIQIDIKFNPEDKESVFGLPNRRKVKKGTTIEWIIDISELRKISLNLQSRNGFKFTLYFEKSTPFEWKTESLRILDTLPPFLLYPDYLFLNIAPIKIAIGTAEKEGDYKYGLKLVSLENEEKEVADFDDDPYLEVY